MPRIIRPNNRYAVELGQELRKLRINGDLTQTALVALTGIPQPLLSFIENGKALPTSEQLASLIKPLRILDDEWHQLKVLLDNARRYDETGETGQEVREPATQVNETDSPAPPLNKDAVDTNATPTPDASSEVGTVSVGDASKGQEETQRSAPTAPPSGSQQQPPAEERTPGGQKSQTSDPSKGKEETPGSPPIPPPPRLSGSKQGLPAGRPTLGGQYNQRADRNIGIFLTILAGMIALALTIMGTAVVWPWLNRPVVPPTATIQAVAQATKTGSVVAATPTSAVLVNQPVASHTPAPVVPTPTQTPYESPTPYPTNTPYPTYTVPPPPPSATPYPTYTSEPSPPPTAVPAPASKPAPAMTGAVIGALRNDGSIASDTGAVYLFPKTLIDANGQARGDRSRRIAVNPDSQTGLASFYDLDPGTYIVCFWVPGASITVGEIQIDSGMVKHQNFRLPASWLIGSECTL